MTQITVSKKCSTLAHNEYSALNSNFPPLISRIHSISRHHHRIIRPPNITAGNRHRDMTSATSAHAPAQTQYRAAGEACWSSFGEVVTWCRRSRGWGTIASNSRGRAEEIYLYIDIFISIYTSTAAAASECGNACTKTRVCIYIYTYIPIYLSRALVYVGIYTYIAPPPFFTAAGPTNPKKRQGNSNVKRALRCPGREGYILVIADVLYIYTETCVGKSSAR